MNSKLLLHTIVHLRPQQVFFQVKNRLVKPAYKAYDTSGFKVQGSRFKTEPTAKYTCLEGNNYTFLNLEHEFAGWNFTDNGMLWAYNQNYFDWINQEGISASEGCKWIDQFIKELPGDKIGLDPYPIALRSINWVKFFCQYPECATKERLDSLYSQLKLLEKKLEYHLLANHLLEDAYALYIGASYFHEEALLDKAQKLLLSQLKEQVLADGAHYEQSPMYHCILLDRLLDCININTKPELEQYASRMLGHLASVVWSDGSFPMLNDAARGIAPEPAQIFDYAQRLGLKWEAIPMKECGYRKMREASLEAIIDVGNITATYQPGHTHADTFNYELRIDGKPFVVDTGISTYNKNERRQFERSTVAHNTVSVDGQNSSEVWGGFRVGKRCHVKVESVEFRDESQSLVESITAIHDGFTKPCERTFGLKDGVFTIEDKYEGDAVSYIHLAEGADEKRITFEGATKIDSKPWKYSTEYNQFHDGKVMEIHFNGNLRYSIQ